MLQLVKYDDPILYEKTKDLTSEDNLTELFSTLKNALIKYKGIGISANQIGINKNCFIMGDSETTNDFIFFGNASIVHKGKETTFLEEGCLTFPGLIVKMKRSNEIRVRYTNEFGEIVTNIFKGLSARCIQHEMCHMQGLPFFFDASKLKLDMAVKKCHKKTGILYK